MNSLEYAQMIRLYFVSSVSNQKSKFKDFKRNTDIWKDIRVNTSIRNNNRDFEDKRRESFQQNAPANIYNSSKYEQQNTNRYKSIQIERNFNKKVKK